MNYRPNRGGITGQVDELIKCLKREGLDVKVVSTHGSFAQRIKGILKALILSFRSQKILGVGAAYLGFIPIVVASLVATISMKKVVFNFHDGQAPAFLKKYSWLVKLVIRKRVIICASRFVTQCFKKKGFNAVEIPYHFEYQKSFPQRKTNFQWNKKVIWARSFMELYQPEMALKAAAIALKQDIKLEFHFFGDGPMLNDLEKKYAIPGIVFRGFIPRDELLKIYNDYSILINTTSYDNFPLSIVEAGYYQLCVLSTKIGGIATIYNSNEVVFFSDAEDLANKILMVLNNPESFQSFRDKLHQKILTFTWLHVREQWLGYLA